MALDDDLQLASIIKELSGVDPVSWGLYSFSRDRYREKVSDERKKALIQAAIDTGRREGERVRALYGSDPYRIAEKLNLRIETSAIKQMKGRIVFATFTYPDLITIMEEPIQKAVSSDEVREIIGEDDIKRLMIGHEIYHVLEERNENLGTAKEKVVLWKLFGKEHTGTLSAPSEIAAASFSETINDFPISPMILDIMLYWGYNREDSYALYSEIMGICGKETL